MIICPDTTIREMVIVFILTLADRFGYLSGWSRSLISPHVEGCLQPGGAQYEPNLLCIRALKEVGVSFPYDMNSFMLDLVPTPHRMPDRAMCISYKEVEQLSNFVDYIHSEQYLVLLQSLREKYCLSSADNAICVTPDEIFDLF